MHSAHEIAVFAENLKHGASHPRHDVHVGDDVGRVGDLHADLGDGRADRTHAVGNNVHGAAHHRAREQSRQLLLHLRRIFPVVGRAGVFLGS